MTRLRISAISYLNTAPLMWDFEHPSHTPKAANGATSGWGTRTGRWGTEHFEISYTVPSACARALTDGTADIGIIPAAAYAEIDGLQVLPDVAIASRRAVRSILLVSKVPVDKVRSVALDTSSMTSVALTKVIFEKWLGGGRTFAPMAPDVDRMLSEHDAGLVIGDPALKIDRATYVTLDLAEEWIRYTGKPFVFAFWAVRGAALQEADPALDLAAVFRDSRDHGLRQDSIAEIAQEWAPRLEISEEDVRRYLTENIHYELDAGCMEGLQLFYQYATEIGALRKAPALRFVDATRAVAL